jgi:hypothetical protein
VCCAAGYGLAVAAAAFWSLSSLPWSTMRALVAGVAGLASFTLLHRKLPEISEDALVDAEKKVLSSVVADVESRWTTFRTPTWWVVLRST